MKIRKLDKQQAVKLYNRKLPLIRRRKDQKFNYDSIVIASDADVDRPFGLINLR